MLTEHQKRVLETLKSACNGCREDMHEPDEQGIYAYVTGEKLDNAGVGPELIVNLVKCASEQNPKPKHIGEFNLATLISLALKAS